MIPYTRIKKNGKVDLWDLGPSRPEPPNEPAKPDAKLTGADKAAAEVAYEDACDLYKQALRKYSADKQAHLDWVEQKSGPVKVELWGVDAVHAMTVEPERFKLDLPKGTKPGKAQLEAEEREQAEAEATQRARASDPQFGQQGATP